MFWNCCNVKFLIQKNQQTVCFCKTYQLMVMVFHLAPYVCATPRDDCHPYLASCTDTENGSYKCKCVENYVGDGKTCRGMTALDYCSFKIFNCFLLTDLVLYKQIVNCTSFFTTSNKYLWNRPR